VAAGWTATPINEGGCAPPPEVAKGGTRPPQGRGWSAGLTQRDLGVAALHPLPPLCLVRGHPHGLFLMGKTFIK